jgi:hypothetical protein
VANSSQSPVDKEIRYMYHTTSFKTWLEDLDTQIKLWGTEADLWATAQFIAFTDLRI